ncbi:MAG TPA: hypothetical protein VGI49_19310 [Mycobacterium sp.]
MPVNPPRRNVHFVGKYRAARAAVALLDCELRSSSDETPDEYIAGGEPGVVVRRSLQIESVDREE